MKFISQHKTVWLRTKILKIKHNSGCAFQTYFKKIKNLGKKFVTHSFKMTLDQFANHCILQKFHLGIILLVRFKKEFSPWIRNKWFWLADLHPRFLRGTTTTHSPWSWEIGKKRNYTKKLIIQSHYLFLNYYGNF